MLSAQALVNEAARMSVHFTICSRLTSCSIHAVHDPLKDKLFELEMSWVGAGLRASAALPAVTHCSDGRQV